MSLSLSFTQRQTQELRLEHRLAQMIELSRMMTLPDDLFEQAWTAASEHPENIEQKLNELAKEYSTPEHKTRAFYNWVNGNDAGPTDGMVVFPDVADLLLTEKTLPEPDVIFKGRTAQKPNLYFSSYLARKMELRLEQLDLGKYPKTMQFLKRLQYFDDWKRSTLHDAYVFIAEHQREYFEQFALDRLHQYPFRKLADDLSIHHSTATRLLRGRYVEAENIFGGRQRILSKDLLITPDGQFKMLAIPILNDIFFKEHELQEAYSDQLIAEFASPKLGTGGIARRTVQKYRQLDHIPDSKERQQAYRAGRQPFQFVGISLE
ncbi:MAG: hypothetical protein V1725_02565 [archaeon]